MKHAENTSPGGKICLGRKEKRMSRRMKGGEKRKKQWEVKEQETRVGEGGEEG